MVIRLELLRVSHADNATTSLVYTVTPEMADLDIIRTILATKLTIFGLYKIGFQIYSTMVHNIQYSLGLQAKMY